MDRDSLQESSPQPHMTTTVHARRLRLHSDLIGLSQALLMRSMRKRAPLSGLEDSGLRLQYASTVTLTHELVVDFAAKLPNVRP